MPAQPDFKKATQTASGTRTAGASKSAGKSATKNPALPAAGSLRELLVQPADAIARDLTGKSFAESTATVQDALCLAMAAEAVYRAASQAGAFAATHEIMVRRAEKIALPPRGVPQKPQTASKKVEQAQAVQRVAESYAAHEAAAINAAIDAGKGNLGDIISLTPAYADGLRIAAHGLYVQAATLLKGEGQVKAAARLQHLADQLDPEEAGRNMQAPAPHRLAQTLAVIATDDATRDEMKSLLALITPAAPVKKASPSPRP